MLRLMPRDERENVLEVDDLRVRFVVGGGLFQRKTYLKAVDLSLIHI